MSDEKVLCFPRSVVEATGIKPGFTACKTWKEVLPSVQVGRFLPRSEAEEDEDWIQLVAYPLIMANDRAGVWPDPRLLCYRRTKAGSEGRLHDLCSLGFGGHVNCADWIDSKSDDSIKVVDRAAIREIEEELWRPFSRINSRSGDFLGYVYDDTSPVSRVHLGLVYCYESSQDEVFYPNRNDGTIEILGWVDRDGRLPDGTIPGMYEAWSRHVLEAR